MATGTAKPGVRKGTAKKRARAKKSPPKKKAAKKVAKKTAKRRKRNGGNNVGPKDASAALIELQQKHPGISSDDYVLQYKIPLEEVFRMRTFISEYLKDWNAKNAAIRMGYPEKEADTPARLLLNHTFVQLRIQEFLAEAEADAICSTGQIMAALWKEGNAPDKVLNGCVMSNSASRTSALKECARVRGMGAAKAPGAGGMAANGIFIVPVAATPDEWESMARKTQGELKQAVTVDI